MKHLKIFEEHRNRPVILYLHGLDGNLGKTKLLFNNVDVQYLGISTDYRLGSIWDVICDMKIDGVIGHSMGGNLAYFLSNFKNIPCLMFMPCFDDETFDIQSIPSDVILLPQTDRKMTVIGSLDDAVNAEKQMKYINGTEIFKHKMGHTLTTDIYYYYCKMFISKFF